MKLTYHVTIKSSYGNYRDFIKEFNNKEHYSNWYRLMINKGHKIIGTTEV
jgi:hypothetical protein